MSSRIVGLDVLRSLAIVGVVLSHGFGLLGAHFGWLHWFGHAGSFGVDLFFVLSGFLIGGILLDLGTELGSPRAVLGFWLRRWWRTVPNYWLFLALNVPFMLYVWKLPVDLGAFLWKFPFFWQSVAWRHPPFFPESWSLAIEEWFYLLFPILIWLGLRFTKRYTVVITVSALVLLIGPLLLRFAMPPPEIWFEDLRKVVIYRLDAIMYGVLAIAACRRWPEAIRRWRYPLLGLGIVAVGISYRAFFVLDLQTSWFAKTWLSSLITFGFALMLPWASAVTSVGWARLDRGIRQIARWSYSMYLCNVPLIIMAQLWFAPQANASVTVALGLFVAYVALVTGLSALVYTYYERPVMRWRDRFALSRATAKAEPVTPSPHLS